MNTELTIIKKYLESIKTLHDYNERARLFVSTLLPEEYRTYNNIQTIINSAMNI